MSPFKGVKEYGGKGEGGREGEREREGGERGGEEVSTWSIPSAMKSAGNVLSKASLFSKG